MSTRSTNAIYESVLVAADAIQRIMRSVVVVVLLSSRTGDKNYRAVVNPSFYILMLDRS